MSTESDPDPGRLPTARQVGMLASLPADWTTAFLVATDALEALGTPQPSRSAALQPRVSNELYVNWQRALSGTRTPGTFALTRLSLGSAGVGKNGELPVTGAGWYTEGAQRTRFVVTGKLERMRTGWVVTGADFVGLGAGR